MPSGPPELHAYFQNDTNAMNLLLSHGYTCSKDFIIRPPNKKHISTSKENDAIDYLVLEWDYGFRTH